MVELLTSPRPRTAAAWWPVDWLIFSYLGLTACAILFYFREIPGSGWLLAGHALGMLTIWAAPRLPERYTRVFRHWYPLPYVAVSFREMSLIIPAVWKGRSLDAELARLDYRIWGVHPTVWLERISHPVVTETLQIIYSLFVPAVLLVAAWLWRQRRYGDFRYYAFLIALGFLVSYVGYLIVPARGPRFLLAHLQHSELRGGWLFQFLQSTLNELESAHYDCFPSGHTELTILAWWSSRKISARWFWAFFVYTLGIISATVYLRYHYTIDIFAGAVVAAVLLMLAPRIYRLHVRGL